MQNWYLLKQVKRGVYGVYRVITYHDVLGSNYLSSPAFTGEGLSLTAPSSASAEEIKNKYEVLAVVCADSCKTPLRLPEE